MLACSFDSCEALVYVPIAHRPSPIAHRPSPIAHPQRQPSSSQPPIGIPSQIHATPTQPCRIYPSYMHGTDTRYGSQNLPAETTTTTGHYRIRSPSCGKCSPNWMLRASCSGMHGCLGGRVPGITGGFYRGTGHMQSSPSWGISTTLCDRKDLDGPNRRAWAMGGPDPTQDRAEVELGHSVHQRTQRHFNTPPPPLILSATVPPAENRNKIRSDGAAAEAVRLNNLTTCVVCYRLPLQLLALH